MTKKSDAISGAGTNFIVGASIWREASEKFFLVVPLYFLALKAQLVVLASAFVMVSKLGQFLVCCSSTHGAPQAPWSRRHCMLYWLI